MSKDTLTIVDNRTGKRYEVPIIYGSRSDYGSAVLATDLRQIKASEADSGLMSYDPGFVNTASCRSSITFVDGERGVLQHRGYPIQQLAENSTYLEVAHLLLYGELPTRSQYDDWVARITGSSMIHESIKMFLEGFHYDAHAMGMLAGVMGALSTFYPDSRGVSDPLSADLHICRLMGTVPTVAAFGYRHSRGLPYIYPDGDLGYVANLLSMLFAQPDEDHVPDPVLVRALDVLFILHADHAQNCSTNTARGIGSALADPYSVAAGAAAALYGPLHGRADEAVVRMLSEVGSPKNVPGYMERVKIQEAHLHGFGHRLYKTRDPRVPIIKNTAEEVFEVTGRNPLMDVALEVERIASGDEYFVSRELYPNTEFYSGIVYLAMGLPLDMMSVLFAIPRVAGWLANWREMLLDEERQIYRPQQIYEGPGQREYVPIDKRG